MFERFTERARQVVVIAQEEARALKHHEIGTGHVLLGILREEEGLGARVLESRKVTVPEVRDVVSASYDAHGHAIVGQIRFTDDAKGCMGHALRMALSFGHNYIGTEHLLLGLVNDQPKTDSVGQAIVFTHVSASTVENDVTKALSVSRSPVRKPTGNYLVAAVEGEGVRLVEAKEHRDAARRAAELGLGGVVATFRIEAANLYDVSVTPIVQGSAIARRILGRVERIPEEEK